MGLNVEIENMKLANWLNRGIDFFAFLDSPYHKTRQNMFPEKIEWKSKIIGKIESEWIFTIEELSSFLSVKFVKKKSEKHLLNKLK